MKMHIRNWLALVTVVLAACSRECPEPAAVFRTVWTPPSGPGTRSLLEDPDIETKKTGITLAAYRDGLLATAAHFTENLDAMVLELEPETDYSIYALVNMGDWTGSLPDRADGLASLVYRIPSYTAGSRSLAARGLPMAGRLDYTGGTTVIPVERLLAKVTAHLSCDWEGAAIESVRVCGLNRVLYPFAPSAAADGEDILDEQEFGEGTGSASGTFVFYVPENRQEAIDGIRESADKSPDRDPSVRARQDILTYLETEISSSEAPLAGDISYRSYLGTNATTDFDIQRNALYDWTIIYHADLTQDQDWKRDGDLFRIAVTADRTEAHVGETVFLTATCYRSDHGEETVSDVTDDALWTRNEGGSESLSVSIGAVTATAPGAASFRAAYRLNGRTAYGDSPVITFQELPPLTLTWASQATYVGQRGRFAVSGLVDGADIAEVTSSDETIAAKAAILGNYVFVNFLSASGSALITVTASNGQTGTYTVSPVAPSLMDGNGLYGTSSYYGHPDGTDVNQHASGHGGPLPDLAYFTGLPTTMASRMGIGSDPSQTTPYFGKTLAPDLYETILKPVITVDDPVRFGTGDGNRIWVKSLAGYPSEGGVAIGTFTARPADESCGVQPWTETIFSVDPFSGMDTGGIWPDFNDKGFLSRYVLCDDYNQSYRMPTGSEVNATPSSLGWDVKLAGAWNNTLKALFSENDNVLSFQYSEGDTLPHVGGLCEVQRTVTNPYSGEKVGKTFLSFRFIVWGAIGGSVVIRTSDEFEVRAAYIGPAAARPAGLVFQTSYRDGELVELYGPSSSWLLNGTVHKDEVRHSLGQTVYTVTLSEGDVKQNTQVYRSISPCITYSGSSLPYYRIEMLEDIQTKSIHPDYFTGWVIPSDFPEPILE